MESYTASTEFQTPESESRCRDRPMCLNWETPSSSSVFANITVPLNWKTPSSSSVFANKAAAVHQQYSNLTVSIASDRSLFASAATASISTAAAVHQYSSFNDHVNSTTRTSDKSLFASGATASISAAAAVQGSSFHDEVNSINR